MFIGHFAPAFAASALGPRAPGLGTTFLAAQLIDWAFFSFAIVGIEKVRIEPGATVMVPLDLYYYPFTHSLLGAGLWALAFALAIFMSRKNAFAGALAGLVVLSHWGLDWVVHRPDLTLMGGEVKYGLGLWNYPAIAMPLELSLALGGMLFYLKRTRGPAGPPIVLLLALLVFQGINWFGPAPIEADLFLHLQALLAFAVLTLMATWVGENRRFVRRGGLAVPNP
ncbi:MAG: hypothetical protein QNI87_03115 [Erythrobacter sp.]|uniref:hypothetical protein n=1 Tax=Erythrobacter sp. TaxID=1042 RepID=UPI00261B7EBA|nr:hypothetical protein [Erythrobacter sp.]MDJ0977501.1 hypothetical protein [Erythrobacter sp.]